MIRCNFVETSASGNLDSWKPTGNLSLFAQKFGIVITSSRSFPQVRLLVKVSKFPTKYEHNPPGCSEGYTMTSTVSVYVKCNDATDVDEGNRGRKDV